MRGSRPFSAISEAVPEYARTNHVLGSGERKVYSTTRFTVAYAEVRELFSDINMSIVLV